MTELSFERRSRRANVHLDAVMSSNSGETLLAALVEGVGIGPLPSFLVRDAVVTGALEPVLEEWKLYPDAHLFAVYPHRRFLSPKVKVFVETLKKSFGDGTRDPWWPPSRT
jgi:DNA-binding transcriptional LysR family regulator